MRKLLFVLMMLPLATIAQDTVYNFAGFSRVTSVYSFQDVYKNTKFDTVDFKGASIKMTRRGNAFFIPSPIADTLLIITDSLTKIKDTIRFCGAVKDSVITLRTNGYTFMGGSTGFYEYGEEQCNGSITDHLFLYYKAKAIPEDTRPRYWDYKYVSVIITIIRKPPKYSN